MSAKTSEKESNNLIQPEQDISVEAPTEGVLADNSEDEVRNIIKAEIHRMEMFAGPLPKPEVLQHYDEVVPGAANRILEMAEREASHRHEMDNKMLGTEARDSLLGIIFATLLCIGTMIAGVRIALGTPNTAGIITGALLGASGLVSVFGLLIKSTRTSWKMDATHQEPTPAKDIRED